MFTSGVTHAWCATVPISPAFLGTQAFSCFPFYLLSSGCKGVFVSVLHGATHAVSCHLRVNFELVSGVVNLSSSLSLFLLFPLFFLFLVLLWGSLLIRLLLMNWSILRLRLQCVVFLLFGFKFFKISIIFLLCCTEQHLYLNFLIFENPTIATLA